MKKLIALLMAATMAFSLCACGGGAAETPAAEDLVPSKEEMLAVAEEFSAYNIQNDSIDNIVRAKQTYCNKTLLLSGLHKPLLSRSICPSIRLLR